MAGDGTGGTAGGEVHGVLSRVMDGSEFKFRSGDELIELLKTPPPGPDAA